MTAYLNGFVRSAAVLALSTLALLTVPQRAGADSPQDAEPLVPAAEHHLHLRSAAGAEIVREIERLQNEPRPGAMKEQTTAADALAALDSASVQRGLVLSVAYMFGSPDVEVEDERARVRAENDYVAEQVAAAPDRLVGTCSVNPLADYALDEIERCAGMARMGAFKLHLTNSDVDLRNEAHVQRLRSVLRELQRHELPAVIHLRTRHPEYGAEDARVFVREVLREVPELFVQIAHMGGWGGYDQAPDAALGELARALAEGELDGDRITFDLSAVVFHPAAAGQDTALARRVREANAQLAERIRKIGPERVVFGTDWPSWPPTRDVNLKIRQNARLLREALPLSREEMSQVFSNVNPILRGDRTP